MNAKTEAMLIAFHADLAALGPHALVAVIGILALKSVEDFIAQNPLPEDADPDEMRSIMLIITVRSAVERVARIVKADEQYNTPIPPTPQETTAKDAADAAIAKAQGKLN